ELLGEIAAYVAGAAGAPGLGRVQAGLRRFGERLEALQDLPGRDAAATRQRFIMIVALLILQQTLQRYRTLLEEDRVEPAVIE
ncbi:FUSC family protein, partial [Pseudomonas paraeruginosa]|nr:FUSC family protein [Pseudomonas paraeruginosa]